MSHNNPTILVIEDDPNVLEAILSILEYSGYRPQGIGRLTEQALQSLHIKHFSLIIMDVMLSGMDGREMARQLKSHEDTKAVPLLMMSAFPGICPSVLQAGADGFIQKPFGLEELLTQVQQCMSIPHLN